MFAHVEKRAVIGDNGFAELVLDNPEKGWWSEGGLRHNPNITWELIQANPEYPWHWHGVSRNPNLTPEIITKFHRKKWDWYNLSFNKFGFNNTVFEREYRSKRVNMDDCVLDSY